MTAKAALISLERCTGCAKCVGACPTLAISGRKAGPHQVNEAFCPGCGLCLPACPHEAITLAPAVSSPDAKVLRAQADLARGLKQPAALDIPALVEEAMATARARIERTHGGKWRRE